MSIDQHFVDLTLPPDKVKEFCVKNDGWSMHLDETWTSVTIEDLYHRHIAVDDPNSDVIGEIANDERASAWILEDIARRYWTDWVIMKGIAVNPSASQELLKRLAEHDDDEVRKKAGRAFLERGAP